MLDFNSFIACGEQVWRQLWAKEYMHLIALALFVAGNKKEEQCMQVQTELTTDTNKIYKTTCRYFQLYVHEQSYHTIIREPKYVQYVQKQKYAVQSYVYRQTPWHIYTCRHNQLNVPKKKTSYRFDQCNGQYMYNYMYTNAYHYVPRYIHKYNHCQL